MIDALKGWFSRPKNRVEHMAPTDYHFQGSPSIRLLDDDGKPIKEEGGSLFNALAALASAIHEHASDVGPEGIDQVSTWLQKWKGPDYVRIAPESQEPLYDVRLSQSEVDHLILYCAMKIPRLYASLEKHDNYPESVEWNLLKALLKKLEPLESEVSKNSMARKLDK